MPVESLPKTRGGDYQVYTGDVSKWLFEQGLASGSGVEPGQGAESFEQARIRLTAEQADSYALRNAVARAELLPGNEVVSGWQAAVGRCRAMLLGIATASA